MRIAAALGVRKPARIGILTGTVLLALATSGCSGGDFGDRIDRVPVAVPDTYRTGTNVELDVPSSNGLLANDEAAGSARALIATAPGIGALTLRLDGALNYQPSPDFFGPVVFEYVAEARRTSDPATVTIHVDRTFDLVPAVSSMQVVQGSSGGIVVSVAATDAATPPASVTVSATGLPVGVTATPVTVPAGSTGLLMLQTTAETPQTRWGSITVTGTLGEFSRSVPLQFRVRGPPGSLDTTFAGTGIAVMDLGSDRDAGNAVAIQADGGILIAGTGGFDGEPAMLLMRLTPDGERDVSFPSWIFQQGYEVAATGVMVLPDGSIRVAGHGSFSEGGRLVLAGLDPDGSYDEEFATGGLRVIFLSEFFTGQTSGATTAGLAIDRFGRFLQAGRVGESRFVACYPGPNWYPQQSGYATTGIARFQWLGPNESTTGLAVDTSGRAVVVGVVEGGGIGVARRKTDGLFDSSFHGDGALVTGTADNAFATSVAVGPAGRLLVGGGRATTGSADIDALVLALDASGAPDLSFGEGGSIVIDTPYEERIQAIRLDEEGRLLAAGRAQGPLHGALLARFLPDGSPDAAFNGNLPYRSYMAAGSADRYDVRAITTDHEGRILLTGVVSSAGSPPFDILAIRVWP